MASTEWSGVHAVDPLRCGGYHGMLCDVSETIQVLIIDADPTFRAVLARLFDRYFDARVTGVGSGAEGIAQLEQHKPDLVLLEVRSAEEGGCDTLTRIRRLKGCEKLPVVAVSAANDQGLIVRLIELGVADYLLKPLNAQLARRRLQKVCDAILSARASEDPDSSSDIVA